METYAFMQTLGEKMNKIQHFYHEWAKAQGVNYNILAVLYVSYKNPFCTQKQICDEWGLLKQTASNICIQLKKDGIITQTPSTRDKRETCIQLTEKGRTMAEPIVEKLLKIETAVLNHMGVENTREFLNTYSQFSDFIEIEFTKSAKSE